MEICEAKARACWRCLY